MVLTATAQTPQTSPPVLQGVVTALGGIQNNPTPPLITLDGIISITNASPGAPLSPGEFISIYGLQLADSTATAPELPFETSLQGVRVQLGGQYLPLQFTSGGQLNAVIPYGLATNVAQDLVVQRGNQTSSVVHVPMADSMPTIFFTVDASGADQGGITDTNGVVYDASNPASAGAAAVIYCTGLGAVDNSSVAAGAAAPANPAANSVSGPLSVTIGGQPVQQILFSGLTPGYTGVYQINVIIPGGLPPGPVPVVVTVAGRPSSPVTITVQ
jgi:adhesin/invasin